MRLAVALGAIGLAIATASIACDEGNKPRASNAATTTNTTDPSGRTRSTIEESSTQQVDPTALRPLMDAANRPEGEPRQRIPLIAVPLTASVPRSWSVQSTMGGPIVLAGKTSEGDVEITLLIRPHMTPETFEAIARNIRETSTQPSDPTSGRRVTVSQRNGMRIIEEVERIGPPNTDPKITPYRWSVQYVVPAGGVDFNVYELNATGISEAVYQADQALLREVFDSVQIDPNALAASTRPVTP